MPFKVPALFRRDRGSEQVEDVGALVAALRRQLATSPGEPRSSTLRGQIAGMESQERVRLPMDGKGESRVWLAGYLAGHLDAWVIRTRGRMPGDLLVPLAAYAAFLVSPPAERRLEEAPPVNLLKTHLLASAAVAERASFPLATEQIAFEWLADQLAIPMTPELRRRFLAWRERRLAELNETKDAAS